MIIYCKEYPWCAKKMLDRCLLYMSFKNRSPSLFYWHYIGWNYATYMKIIDYNYEMKMAVTWNKEKDMYQIKRPMSILYQKIPISTQQ